MTVFDIKMLMEIDVNNVEKWWEDETTRLFFNLQEIERGEEVPVGANVIHKTTLEIGVVEGECLGYGKCKVLYPDSTMWHPQPKRNILLIK